MIKSVLPTILILSVILLVNLFNIQSTQANYKISRTVIKKNIFTKYSNKHDRNNQILITLIIAGVGATLGWSIAFIYYRRTYKKIEEKKCDAPEEPQSDRTSAKVPKPKKIIESPSEPYIKPNYYSSYIVYIEQAYKCLSQGDTQGALKNFNEAIRSKPNSARVYSERANFRKNKLGDKQGAIEDYTQAIAINPNDALLYFFRSQTYQELGNQKKAIEDYNAAMNIAPDHTMYYGFIDEKYQND